MAILLPAARFGKPVCPHAGGVGLCEPVQHLPRFDYVAVSGTTQDRIIEYVEHLHDHFVDPVETRHGAYRARSMPGFSGQMKQSSPHRHGYPGGSAWA